jgi:Ca-activated chloride channel homolog
LNTVSTILLFSFAQPWAFALLPLVALLLHLMLRKKKEAVLLTSHTSTFKNNSYRLLSILMTSLKTVALVLSIFALARPQDKNVIESNNGSGIDIVFSIDISGSMLSQDFTPNRLEVAKKVVTDFISKRPQDRMGLVIFSGESFSLCPLTTDQTILQNQVANMQSGQLADGTAIGMGLATSIERIRQSDAKSKIVILLTDGVNNMGLVDPQTALEIAKTYSIKVYTIGIGNMGMARMPIGKNAFDEWVFDMQKVEIDEALLNKIATETGGKYYRAIDNASLSSIYKEIDKLEKSKLSIDKNIRYKELYYPLLIIAFLLFCGVFIAEKTIFKGLFS